MNSPVPIRRLATGVPGLDVVLGGGLPEFSFNLIAGPPGCGKTTLAHQMMFALATPERPALYFTVLGEPPLKMLRYQQQFGFFDASALNTSVHFINLAQDLAGGDLGEVRRRIVTEVGKHQPGLVVMDSFRAAALAQRPDAGTYQLVQQFLQEVGVLMTSWQATTFLIGEYADVADADPVFAVADGLIRLRQSVQRNSMVRKLEVVKMRGEPTLAGLHTFRIGAAGIEVFPPAGSNGLHAPRPVRTAPPVRLSVGIPELDAMLGGGLPAGYSLLVAGPSGSGKSILAAAFLAEGARQGETSVIAAFESRAGRASYRHLDALVDEGRIGVVDTSAPDLSIEEVAQLLLKEIGRLKASRVVIDSLSGFELSLAPTFRADFRESLAHLVTALARTGVTLLMTSELEDRYTELRFSPYGTAFLTDAIIVQRYIELESRLRRVMAVVKVRASKHSDELREFHIRDDGLHVGASLPGQEGLLGGRPTKKPADDAGPSHREATS